MMTVDLILLAGGRGSRLGGDKPSVVVAGRTLLDRALDARVLAQSTVLVGPENLVLPQGILPGEMLRAAEDPPFGGPVAGIVAGLTVLNDASEWTLVIACDLPRALDAARLLVDAASAEILPADVDGLFLEDENGRAQWLCALYRTRSLTAAALSLGSSQHSSSQHGDSLHGESAHGASVRMLVRGLTLRAISDPEGVSDDVDTWDDVAASTARLGTVKPR